MIFSRFFEVRCLAVVTCIVVCLLTFSSLASFHLQAAILIPDPPKIEATAYVLMDAKTGKVITAYNADEQVPPASLTKMMTSYITTHEIEKGNISESDKTQISIKAWKAEGSRMFIKEGTYVSVIDLLKGVIIQSGNDASIALAEYVAGDEDAFADLMNRYALELGMENTHFKNATGLPHSEHLTTANDLAKLARAIIYDHPEHYRIYSQKTFTYNKIKQDNRNSLIFGEMPVDGLKTGHTEAAGYCLVASAEKNNTRFISVVLGTESERARARESKKLLTYGFRFYETAELYKTDDVVDEQQLWMGENDAIQLGVAEDLLITIPRGSKKDLNASVDVDSFIKAPVKAGDKLGTLKISLEGKVIAQQDLIALSDQNKGGIFKQLVDFIKMFFASLFA
jgi:D-alanyl-D-alanine carboxypeptidase (penicillin-binding protein 5/6)